MSYDNCKSCPYILKKVNSCYRNNNFEEQNIFETIFEYTMVFCSVYPYILGIYFLIIPIIQRTARNMILNAIFILSVLGCEVLKKLIKQPRPEGSCSLGHGFPSSHAGLSGFLLTFYLIEYFFNRKAKRIFSTKWHYEIQQIFVLFTSPLVLYSRHYLNYHDLFQIMIGFLVGIISAIIVCIIAFQQIDNSESILRKLLNSVKYYNDYQLVLSTQNTESIQLQKITKKQN